MSPCELNVIAISEPACSSVTSRLDDEFRIDQESRTFAGDDDFIAPRQHGAERAVDLGFKPFAVAELGLIPIGEFLHRRPPAFVGRIAFERAALFLDDHAGHEPGRAGIGIRGFDGDHVDAGPDQLGDVVDIHLSPIGAGANFATVDVQLVLIVAGDVDLGEVDGVGERDRLAEIDSRRPAPRPSRRRATRSNWRRSI